MWWPIVAFWGMIVNRLLGILLGQAPEGREAESMQRSWGATAIFYLLSVFATILLPVPELGITQEVVSRQEFETEGGWIDAPQLPIASGFLYFTAVAWSELYDHSWFKDRPTNSPTSASG